MYKVKIDFLKEGTRTMIIKDAREILGSDVVRHILTDHLRMDNHQFAGHSTVDELLKPLEIKD